MRRFSFLEDTCIIIKRDMDVFGNKKGKEADAT